MLVVPRAGPASWCVNYGKCRVKPSGEFDYLQGHLMKQSCWPSSSNLSFITLAASVSQPVASHTESWMVFCSPRSRTGGLSHSSHDPPHTLLYCPRSAHSFLFMFPTIHPRWKKKETNIKHMALSVLFMGNEHFLFIFKVPRLLWDSNI